MAVLEHPPLLVQPTERWGGGKGEEKKENDGDHGWLEIMQREQITEIHIQLRKELKKILPFVLFQCVYI